MPSHLLGVPSNVDGDTSTVSQSNPPALPAVCAKVHAQLEAFLARAPVTEKLRRVQDQTRTSLAVIQEALARYR